MVLTPPPGPLQVLRNWIFIHVHSIFLYIFSENAWYHLLVRTILASAPSQQKLSSVTTSFFTHQCLVASTCQCLAYLWSVRLHNRKKMQLCYTVFSFPGPASRCSCHYSAGVPTCGCVTFPKQTNCTAGTPWYTIHDVPSQATWGLGTGHLVTRLATQLAQEAFLRIHAPCLCRGGKALVRLTFASFTQRMVPRCFRGVKLYWFLEFGPWWSDVGPNPSTMSRSFFKGIPDDRIGMGSLVAHAGALDEMPKRGCPAFKSRPAFTNSSLDVDHPTIRLLQATILKEFAAGNAPSDWKYGPGM